MTLRVAIVDDHPLARVRLKDLIAEIGGIDFVGEASDGEAAIDLIRSDRPDLVFLDIRMPGMSGLEVLRRANPRPLVIFTTAHDSHAVTAFELHALDYLLKPFGKERLEAAVQRARSQLSLEERAGQLERAVPALDGGNLLERVYIHQHGRIVPVKLNEVEHIESRGDYVRLWSGGRSFLLRAVLASLLERLDGNRFVRIHRSHVVNLDKVKAFTPFDAARLQLELESGKKVLASRPRSAELRKKLNL